jgi:CRISPR-associated protein Csx17
MANEVRLPVLALPGLSPDSLGNYLASLGLLSVLARKWPSTRIAWRDKVLHVVGGPPTFDALLDELVRIASERAWTQYDKEWSDAQKRGTKTKSGVPLAFWQAEAREDLLPLFAAHAVPHARVSFNPLLGSGGNAGRRDFAAGWRKAVDALAAAPKPAKAGGMRKAKSAAPSDEKRNALQALLLGHPVTWMVEKLGAGSWFSEATKLYNSGQSPAREGLISPWAMVLACEGLAFFAGSASRRLGARSARAVGAFPFITKPIAASAEKEADRLRAEIWVPLWDRPMSFAEVNTLFSRGRAELHGRAAVTPAAFATAIRKRGVDAGVSSFSRFTLGRTTSANTFEPRLEARFTVGASSWQDEAVAKALERITALLEHRGFPRDGERFVGLRGPIEAMLLAVATEPGNPESSLALLDAVVGALDRIDRNRRLPSLFADEQPGVEARLALSLVSAFPETLPFASFRFGVEWIREQNSRYEYDWTTEPRWFEHSKVAPARWVWGPGELARVLGALLSRRLLEEARLDKTNTERPRGRAPLPATPQDIRHWLAGDLDESLLWSWLSRLALFDWRRVPKEARALMPRQHDVSRVDGELVLVGLLQPLVDRRPLVIRELSANDLLSEETGARTTEAARSLVTLIRAGSLDVAYRLASSRYAMAGARLATLNGPFATYDPDRLAAALLFPITDRDRASLFERWLRPRRRPQGEKAYA